MVLIKKFVKCIIPASVQIVHSVAVVGYFSAHSIDQLGTWEAHSETFI